MSAAAGQVAGVLRFARVVCIGDRQLPLPKVLTDALREAIDTAMPYHMNAARIRVELGQPHHETFMAETLLMAAAAALLRYPRQAAALEAVRAAVALLDAYAEPPPVEPTRWEQKAGLMG